jgi:cell division protein FtsW
MSAIKLAPRQTDFTLIILALTATVVGILMVFDASYDYALQMRISEFRYVSQQALYGLVGIVGMLWAAYYPYWKWRLWGNCALAISIALLVAVFLPHIGIEAKGAHRWVGYGSDRIQPSEIAKLAVVLFLARACAGRFNMMRDFVKGPLAPLCFVALPALWTAVEPDLGTSIVLFVTAIGTLFFAGMKFRHVALVLLVALVVGCLFLGFKSIRHSGGSFQVARLLVFLHPEQDRQGDGYQVYHSLVALGSGGLAGLGIGEGREKMYLPEAHTDFIFAVLGEETGLIGTLAMLVLLVLLVGRGFHIATTTNDSFGALLAAGISLAFGIQTFINIGVDTSSIPATGVPLPFISYGGSSLVISLIMVGILLNVAKFPNGDPSKERDENDRPSDRQFDAHWDKGPTLSRPEYSDKPVFRSSAKPYQAPTRNALRPRG